MTREADFQSSFAAAVADPGAATPARLFRDLPGQRDERFSVYRNNVISGLIDALAGSFPVVQRLVGVAFFRAMAREYVVGCPPRSPVLMHYGDRLPAFIAGFPPAAGLPYLGDVAALEAARIRAYHAADRRALAPADVDAAGSIALHPAAQLIRSPFPIHSIWTANQPGSQPVAISLGRAQSVLLTRPEMTVHCHLLEDAQADIIADLTRQDRPLLATADRMPAYRTLAAMGALCDPTEGDHHA
ncbi:DNA-binding domain-containing protein [Mesorhizobium sp. CAU 1741]|uniref:DNA-binding domain-containing protein n=1 Tax=Mesorhizobium sp. CAU 1741 TaxID=3140366 RepID=UPI00325B931A